MVNVLRIETMLAENTVYKCCVFWVALVFTNQASILGQQGTVPPSNPAISISISLPQPQVAVGSHVFVRVSVTNRTGESLTLPSLSSMILSRIVEIKDEHGVSVKNRSELNGASLLGHGSRFGLLVRPGMTSVEAVDISEQYDLAKTGTYSIVVKRRDPQNGVVVDSNIVSLVVVSSQ